MVLGASKGMTEEVAGGTEALRTQGEDGSREHRVVLCVCAHRWRMGTEGNAGVLGHTVGTWSHGGEWRTVGLRKKHVPGEDSSP